MLTILAEKAKGAGGRPPLASPGRDAGPADRGAVPDGDVSEQGRKVCIPTPFNDKVVELITAVPPGTLKPDPKHLDPLVAMLPK